MFPGGPMAKTRKTSRTPHRVQIINYEFPPLGGGGGVASYDLGVEWARHGQCDVLTSSFRDVPREETVEGMNIYRARIFFRKSRDAASFLSLLSFLITGFFLGVRLIRKNRYDIINTQFAVPTGPLGQLLSWMFDIPNVLSLHGGDIYDPSKKMSPHKSPFFKRVVLQMLRRADKVIAQSSNTRDNALNYYQPGVKSALFRWLSPPVVVKKTRKELGLDRSEFALVSIGRIVKRKALDVLITALASIKDEKIKLHILGDGPERPALEKLAADLGISHRVIFEGFVDNDYKYAMLANADLFTLTSLHEASA